MQTAVQTSPLSSASPRNSKHVPAGSGKHVWFLDNLITVKLDPAEDAPFAVVENAMPAGSHTPFHQHENEDEAFYVLEGSLRFYFADGHTIKATCGDYIHVPRGVAHGFRTLTPTRVLVLTGACGFIEMLQEAGDAAPSATLPSNVHPDIARLEAACERHRITLLGPLPE